VCAAGAALWPLARRLTAQRVASRATAAPAGAPNVLLIILDTVGAQEMSLYGYAHATTPEIDSIARSGVVFDRAIAPSPWTLPSHGSMFTGRESYELSARFLEPLDDGAPVVAERFSAAGYRTAGFVANLEYATRESGLARGFQWFDDDFPAGAVLEATALSRRLGGMFEASRGYPFEPGRKRAADVTAEFLAWRDKGERPYFAFLNYYDAHAPYTPPRSVESRFLSDGDALVHALGSIDVRDPRSTRGARAAYDAAIYALDHEIGRLLRELERRGDLAGTLIVITADHGEEFGEHGVLEHGNSLYLPALHVPLIVLRPGRIPAGRRVATPVSTRHVALTMLALAGLDRTGFAGTDLAAHWAGADSSRAGVDLPRSWVEQVAQHPASYPVATSELHSVLRDSLHLIRGSDVSLFNVALDPREAVDLSRDAQRAGDLQALQRLLPPRSASPRRRVSSTSAPAPTPP
jgi:arylsulfatase A-like enzyme